jgi:insulysin
LELHPESEIKNKYPIKIFDEEGIVVWYKRDYSFNLPKAIAICQIYLNKNIKHYVEYETIAYIWNSIIENELRELSYMAREANVHIKFHANNEGMYLSVTGFNLSLFNALSELVKLFKSLSAHDKQEKLKVQVERHIQEMMNFYFKPPYSQVIGYLEYLLVEPSVLPCDKLRVLNKGINIELLVDFVTKLHLESRFEWIIQGNLLQEEALIMAKTVQEIVQDKKLPVDQTIVFRTVNIKPKSNYVYMFDNVNPQEANSSIASFYQCGKLDDKGSCLLYVCESLLTDKFFNELRTKQALGYITMLFHRDYRFNEGLVCLVQSSVKPPEYVWQRIKLFFEDIEKQISELSDELFSTHVNSVITNKKQKDLKLSDEIYRNAYEIKSRAFVFDRREKQIAILENLKKEELVNFFNEMFVNNQRRLDVELVSAAHKEDNTKLEEENLKIAEQIGIKRIKVKSIQDFKRRNSLFPDFFSMTD